MVTITTEKKEKSITNGNPDQSAVNLKKKIAHLKEDKVLKFKCVVVNLKSNTAQLKRKIRLSHRKSSERRLVQHRIILLQSLHFCFWKQRNSKELISQDQAALVLNQRADRSFIKVSPKSDEH